MTQRWPRIAVLDQLRGSPRFGAFMLLLLPTAAALGAKEAARLDYVTDEFGSALGIGLVGALIAVGVAIGGSIAGPLYDRFDPRAGLLLSLLMVASGNLVTSWLIGEGAVSAASLQVAALWDGLALGVGAPALLKVQAALVPVDARGSGEIVNILRLSVGGLVGIYLAGLSPSPQATLLACAIVVLAAMVGVAILTRAVRPLESPGLAPGRHGSGIQAVRHALRGLPSLRLVVIADLMLAFAVPTQLANVFVVDEGGGDGLVLPVLMGGVVGVMVGRLALVLTGSLGHVRRQLLVSFGGFTCVVLASMAILVGIDTADAGVAAGALFLAGSATSSYSLGLLAALVQQQVPDTVRGALSGYMAAARSLLAAAAAAFITLVILPMSTLAVLAALGVLAVACMVATRGFRGIAANVA